MNHWAIDPQDIVVYCDESSDRNLLLQLQTISPFLGAIAQENVYRLPKGEELHGAKLAPIVELADYDRPDYIFLYRGSPVLVVELTEHGYTGDNPLQRFTRFATTAENRLPFVYFTPFSRVRDDELDQYGGANASKRNVNTNVWRGMTRLSKIFEVPQLAFSWPLAPNGKPRKPGFSPSAQTLQEIFGELVTAVVELLQLSPSIVAGISIMDEPFVQQELKKVEKLWVKSNVHDTSIKSYWTQQHLIQFLQQPANVLQHITVEGYFFHDKPERLLALQCIRAGSLETIQLPNHEAIEAENVIGTLGNILATPQFDAPFFYYTGYQWRSDPHCGVAVNLDYLYCRIEQAKTPSERSSALVVYWPRIFYSAYSKAYQEVYQQLNQLYDRNGELYDLFLERYATPEQADARIDQLLLNRLGKRKANESLIGIWNDNTKQARIFRQYCDLLVLSDAVIIGNHWHDRL